MKHININLYQKDGVYYRLFGRGITSNQCWIIDPVFVELIDIDSHTGKDIYGKRRIKQETGTIQKTAYLNLSTLK
jgi:hypothetical protein